MKNILILLILLLASTAYADIRGVPLGLTDSRYLSKVSDDITTKGLDVRGNLTADSISADILWLNGYEFPTDTPNDNEIIKFDSALGRFNYEADATGAGGAGLPGLGNQYEITYWGNTDASLSGDSSFTINPTTNLITITGIVTDGSKTFSVAQASGDIGIALRDRVSQDTIQNYVSKDTIEDYVSQDTIRNYVSGDVVKTVVEGVAGPLAITPSVGYQNVTVSIQSADSSTAGYISAANYNTWTNDRVSQDAVLSTLIVGAVDNTEIGYLDGVTSAIQTQFSNRVSTDAVLNTLRTYGTTTLPNFVSTDAVLASLAVASVSNTEIGYLDGVTSAIQTQFSNRVSGDVVKSITEGVAGPLVITPSAGYQYPTVSIQSVDATGTDGYLKSMQYQVITNDVADVKIQQKSIAIIEPDQIATVSRDILMFPVDAYNFPGGITITKVGLATSTVTTTSYAFEEWTSADVATTTTTSIDVIYLTNSAESTDTGIADATVAAGSWVVCEVDNVDINAANMTIWFTKK